MRRARIIVAFIVLLAGKAAGEPRIAPGGVVNAAGLSPAGLPGSSIARGSLITILGAELGPVAGAAWDGVQLQPELAGVSVTAIDSSGALHTIYPVFVRYDQINALMPCAVALGAARITVIVSGRRSQPSDPFLTVERNFQIFTRNRKGWGGAVAENLSGGGPVFNSLTTPAARGQVVALWGTGLGTCNEAEVPSDHAGPSGGIQVVIGNHAGRVLEHKRVAGHPGVEQILAAVPADAPETCYVPVVVRTRHQVSNFASLSIARQGAACSDNLNGFTLLTEKLKQGPISWARIQLLHGKALTEWPGILLETSSELGEAAFLRSSVEALDSAYHYPALGTCVVRPLSGTTVVSGAAGAVLNAGNVDLMGPWHLRFLRDPADGIYRRRLSPTPFEGRSGDFIRPNARYMIVGQAGPDVGPFHASVGIPGFLQWTNRDRLPFALQRWAPLVLTWLGGDPDREFVVIRGYSHNRELNVGREFVCTAPVEARTFSLPFSVLSLLPDSSRDMFVSVSTVRQLSAPSFVARGIDVGFLAYEVATGRNFSLQ